jgi:hypothetical protein
LHDRIDYGLGIKQIADRKRGGPLTAMTRPTWLTKIVVESPRVTEFGQSLKRGCSDRDGWPSDRSIDRVVSPGSGEDTNRENKWQNLNDRLGPPARLIT